MICKSNYELIFHKKFFRVMKLTFLFLFLGINLCFATESYSQRTYFHFKLNNTTVRQVIKTIENSSEFIFFYRDNAVDMDRRVSVNADNKTISEILDQLFAGSDNTYIISDRQIVINKTKKAINTDGYASPQQRSGGNKIRGSIIDDDGQPLIGVSVKIEGTSQGVITDLNGEYAIAAKPTDHLVFSYIGMVSQNVRVGNQKVINITMHADNKTLGEVTVVAFAKQKKESVVGSITTVRPSDLKVPSSNLTTAFAGRVSGLISYQLSGEPGEDNAQFFVRGVTTFGTGKADPLILIDNIELSSTDLARLSPDDIASFSVLKDATATALYGARGANGVILVTTKEGTEGKVKVNFRYETSLSQSTRNIETADPLSFMQLQNEAVRTRNPLEILPYSDRSIDIRKAGGANPYVYPMVDWMDMLLNDYTINNRANINLSGGGSVARYYVALSYNRDNGLLHVDPVNNFNNNISLNKYSVRSNVNINLTKSTELTVRVNGTFDDYQGPMNGGATMYNYALKSNPVLFPAYYPADEAHKYTKHILFGNYGDGGIYMNPYAEMLRGYKQYNATTVIAQLELKQKLDFITKGLSFRLMGNATAYSYFDIYRHYSPFYYSVSRYDAAADKYTLTGLNDESGTDYLSYNSGEGSKIVNRSFYVESQISYDRTFKKHTFGGTLIMTGRENLTGNASTLESSLAERNLNLSGRFTYGYDNRYFFEANFGYNGSEKFDKNHRWGFFPSAGISWMISNERFYKDKPISKIVPSLKLKATYGLVGNDAISSSRFFYLSEVNMNDWNRGHTFGYNLDESKSGISFSRYADKKIGWEISHKSDIGIIANLFNDIDIEADYFHERRTNILMTRADIPATMGLQSTPNTNIGEATGDGCEFSINGGHHFTNDFWMRIMFNFTYAASKYKVYEEPDYSATPWLSHEGRKLSQSWGWIAERLFVDKADVDNSPVQQFGEYMAGDIKYKDINQDGIIDSQDVVPIGYPTTPEITYGFGTSVGYHNIDFSVFFQGQGRSSFYIEPAAVTPFVNSLSASRIGSNAVLKFIENDHWSEDNQNIYAAWPRLSTYWNWNNDRHSTWWLRNGSLLRLKSAEIGYTLPNKFIRKANMSLVRFYLSGTNLLCWSKFKLWDVEMGGNGLGYPNQRVFNLGVQVNF